MLVCDAISDAASWAALTAWSAFVCAVFREAVSDRTCRIKVHLTLVTYKNMGCAVEVSRKIYFFYCRDVFCVF